MAIRRTVLCVGAMLVVVCLSVIIARCLYNKKECKLSSESSDYMSSVDAPCRVHMEQASYIALLDLQTNNTPALECSYSSVVQVVTSDFIVMFESPLVESRELSSLPKVYNLGQALVALLLTEPGPEKEILDLPPIISAYIWIICGLRKETGVSSRLCAIELEKKLITGVGGSPSGVVSLKDDAVLNRQPSYLANTVSFVENRVDQLKYVNLYGKSDSAANKVIPELLNALDQITCNLANSNQVKQIAYSLPSIFAGIPDSIKKQVLMEYVDLLLADVDLHLRSEELACQGQAEKIENSHSPIGIGVIH